MKENDPICFVDTNILVYAFDRLEGQKHELAARLLETLWKSRTGVLSTQVLQEFHVAITRQKKRGISLKQSQEIINSFSYWPIYTPRANDIVQAIDLQERYQLSFWDSLILQSAISSKCKKVYSEDLSHGQVIEGVQIVNPFREDLTDDKTC